MATTQKTPAAPTEPMRPATRRPAPARPGSPEEAGPRTRPLPRDSRLPHQSARTQQPRVKRYPAPAWQRVGRTAVAVAAVLSTTGCWLTNPAATTMDYSPAEGIQERVGEVELHNVLIVATAAEQPGRVLGTLVNNSDQEVTLSMDAAGATAQVRIPAQEAVNLEDTTPVLLERAGADPGLMVDTTFTTPGHSVVDTVPVLDGTLTHFAEFIPDEAPPAPAPPSTP